MSWEPHNFDYRSGVATAVWRNETEVVSIECHAPRFRHAAVAAEVRVFVSAGTSYAQEMPRELARERVNDLLGSRNQADLAKKLNGRHQGWPWDRLVESACWAVVDAVRHGRPEILLRDAPAESEERLAVAPFLADADATMIFGDGSAAKSYLSLALATILHTGRELITGIRPEQTKRVAIFDWEWRPEPHRRRLARLWGPVELPDLVYVPCAAEGPLTEQVDRLLEIIRRHRIEYAVLDSVALGCDGPPEDSSVALAYFGALARLGVGTCLIAHVNRSGDTTRPFGSQYWHNSARRTWFVKRVQEDGSDELDLGLYCRKVNDGKPPKPVGLHFDFSPDRTVISLQDVHAQPDLATETPLIPRLVDALRRRSPQTYQQLAEATGTDVRQVRNRIAERAGRTFVVLTQPGSRNKQIGLLSDPSDDVFIPFPGGSK